MASNQRIDDLIAQQAFEQVERLTKELGGLNSQMVESIKLAKKYSDTLAGAKGMRDINNGSANVAKEVANIQKLQNETTKLTRAQQEQLRLAEKRQRVVRESTADDLRRAQAQRTETASVQQNTQALAANEATMRRNSVAELQGEQAAARYRAARLGTTVATAEETAALAANTAAQTANSSAISRVGQSLTRGLGYLKTLAYVLPGIGIAGIFNVIYEGLDKIFTSKEKFNSLIDNFKTFNSLIMQAGASSGAEIAKIDALFRAIGNNNLSLKERNIAVKQLQDMYPEHLSNLTIDNSKTEALTKQYKALKQELINIAYVQAGYNKIAEATSRIFDDEFRINEERVKNLDLRKKFNAAQKAENELNASGSRTRNANNDALDAGIRKTTQLAQAQGELAKSDKIITDLAKDRAINQQRISNIEAQIDSRVKRSGVDILGGENDKQKKVKDTSSDDELRALEYQYEQQIALAREQDKELAELEKEYIQQIKNYRKEAYESSIREFEDYGQTALEATEDSSQAQLIALEESYAKGKTGKAEYEKQKLDIEYEANRQSLEIQLSTISQIIALNEKLGYDVSDEKKKLSDLTRRLAKADADYEIAQIKSVAEARKALNSAVKDFAKEAFNLGVSLVNASYENEKNRIQEQSDAIDIQKDKDIKEVDRQIGSEQEKADKIAVINAKAQAQKDVLDQRRREVAQRQAKFDKAVSLANIVQNTYAGAARALKDYPFPFSSIIAGLVIATGLAQAAQVIATPIPKYAKGTNYHKGGAMIVGDAGTELVIEPNGKQYLTPDTDTLTSAPEGTKVIPNHELVKMMSRPDKVNYVGGQHVDIQQLIKAQNKTTAAIQKQQMSATLITKSGWTNRQLRVSNFQNYKQSRLN